MARRLLAATPMSTRAGPSTDRCSRKGRLDAADNRTRSCCYAAYGLRTRRRRSRDRPSLVSPPQMPCLIEFASAYSRHWARTGHRVHTAAAFASRMSRSCGLSPSRPKNSSASLPTQAALSCQLTPQHSRPATSAHLGPLPGSRGVSRRPRPSAPHATSASRRRPTPRQGRRSPARARAGRASGLAGSSIRWAERSAGSPMMTTKRRTGKTGPSSPRCLLMTSAASIWPGSRPPTRPARDIRPDIGDGKVPGQAGSCDHRP
jgi:hypothetical protein